MHYTYHDFRLELHTRSHAHAEGKRLVVAKAECPLGWDAGWDHHRVMYPVDVDDLHRLTNLEEAAQARAAGELIGQVLLGPPRPEQPHGQVYRMFRESLNCLRSGEGLRLVLHCRDRYLSGVPWEFARVQLDGELATTLAADTRISLVRYGHRVGPGSRPLLRNEVVVAALDASQAGGTAYADLPEYRPNLPSEYGGRPVRALTAIAPATQEALETALARRPVDVFQFWGHGERSEYQMPSGLVLDRVGGGGRDVLTGADLAPILLRAGVSIAVIVACHSGASTVDSAGGGVAEALVDGGIPVVVAMQGRVDVRCARAFTSAFYESLFAGATVDEAVMRGRAALLADCDFGRPVLYHRSGPGAFLDAMPQPSVAPSPQALVERADPAVAGADAPVSAARLERPAGSWSQLRRRDSFWRVEPGVGQPLLRRVVNPAEPPPAGPDELAVAVAPDGGAAVQWGGRSTPSFAWIDRSTPELCPWTRVPVPPEYAAARLLAVAVGDDEVWLLLTTEGQTLELRITQREVTFQSELVPAPSRAGVYLDRTACTVDLDGRVRETSLQQRLLGMQVVALDAVAGGAGDLVAAVGVDNRGPLLVAARPDAAPTQVPLPAPATNVVVVRELDEGVAPRSIVSVRGSGVTLHEV